MTRKLLLLMAIAIVYTAQLFAQSEVYSLLERRDLKISQIENLANAFFKKNGTGRGTGYKQFQRWLYEAKFHTDVNGYIIPSNTLPADPSKQQDNGGYSTKFYYKDIKYICQGCGENFIWSAKQQKKCLKAHLY